MTSRPQDLSIIDIYKVHGVADGTTTVMQIVADDFGVAIGHGTARRRKNEKRHSQLGELIALRRACQDAIENIDIKLKRHGYGDYA